MATPFGVAIFYRVIYEYMQTRSPSRAPKEMGETIRNLDTLGIYQKNCKIFTKKC